MEKAELARKAAGVDDKIVYRLWWEYLKRSDDFKDFCQWHRDRRDDPDIPLPRIILDFEDGLENHPFTYIFGYFLDIHADQYRGRPYGFEVWYEWFKKREERTAQNRRMEAIEKHSAILKELEHCIQYLRRTEKREPTVDALKKYFSYHVQRTDPPKIYLEVDLTREDPGLLVRRFNELILQEKKSSRIQWWETLRSRENWPKSMIVVAELKRYIMVYDLWKKGLDIPKIIRKIGTANHKANWSDENVQNVYREDLAKVKAIIKNTERGRFPGFYGKYSMED